MEGSHRSEHRSDALEVLHETMSGLYRHGVIDKATMRHFDVGCLPPPGELRALNCFSPELSHPAPSKRAPRT